ncbi:MAG: aspartate-semialdehyde dehydrogenase [Bdellovibrionaceae bacterium]|nr:aspartate-semialdehyde dehydrogenase [Bdellovibrionales bacterium]MCB9254823.1 aspartate-semialdehyde dehydrogenase [Pseudobdellovibrionaceae bacterium]
MFEHLEKIESLAIVGATGLVGKEFLEILEDHKVAIPKLKFLASKRSAGEYIRHQGKEHLVEELAEDSFNGIEVAFFSVPKEVSARYIPSAVNAGATVIDDSNLYRMEPGVPLVVPQVNGESLKHFEGKILTTPNCSTTPLAMCLKPLLDNYGVSRVVASTYQAVSGAGQSAFDELSKQTIQLMNGNSPDVKVFPHRIAFNCLPQIGSVLENGNTDEEEKVIRELRKILETPNLKVSATAVRVPTFCGHGLSVNVELENDFGSVDEIRELLEGFPGIRVVDNPASHIYPTNIECVKSNYTFVGRIRRDQSVPSGINFWVIADNLRKGAALNVLETLESLYSYRSLH